MKQQHPSWKEFVAWDIVTWSRALHFWKKSFASNSDYSRKWGLEIGANGGGLSLFFATTFGSKMLCSDMGTTATLARSLHKNYDVAHLIEYAEIDATAIPFCKETFDFVVFKSVLGVIGAKNHFDEIEQAMQEIHRVLKPGGVLFFAENLQGSRLHRLARRWFIPWGKNWYYLNLAEMDSLLRNFAAKEIHTTGFFSAFVPKPEWLKNSVARIDPLFFFLPKNWRYVCYGYAVK